VSQGRWHLRMMEESDAMTPRERMLAAYRNQQPDRVPVSPEIWDATSIEVDGRPWHELVGPFAREPWWKIHLRAFQYFGADAWIVAEPSLLFPKGCEIQCDSQWIAPDTIETRTIYRTPCGELRAVSRTTPIYAGWLIEHPIKRFPEDMKAYEPIFFPDPGSFRAQGIDEIIKGVGEEGLVTASVGELFTSALASLREGGYSQLLNDLLDHPDYCRELRNRFISHQAALAEAICKQTEAQALFINSGYAAPPITSPAFYREWDLPALAAVGEVARRCGVSLHLHQHGRVGVLMEDLIGAGVSIVCPLLPPPQGDVKDLAEVKRRFGSRIALKGNIDPFGVLLQGTPEQVEEEVKACIAAGAAGGGFVLGTADSTLPGTPFDNLRAFVAAGRKYGDYESGDTRIFPQDKRPSGMICQ